jgi:outer membrane receptor protein involved in Fe transport
MRRITTCLAVLLLVAAAIPAVAQTVTGTVEGLVKDEQGGALPGVSVTLTGKRGSQSTVTENDGSYRFGGVDPGTYTVTAAISGFRTKRQENVIVSIGRPTTINVTLAVAGVQEAIEVVGESPVVNPVSSATDNSLSQDMLFNLPIRPSNAATDLLNYLPGIVDGSAYGADQDTANGLLIDGVDTRDPEGGSAWSFFNYNIVEEVQVSGIGAPAEFGAFQGAVVNTITKSGGNNYSGLFDAYYTKGGLQGNNSSQAVIDENPSLADPGKDRQRLDLTAQLGGPIVRDKLFFFLSGERYHRDQDPSGPNTLRNEVSARLNLKLNYQPGPNDNFMGMVQYDNYNITGRCGPPDGLCTFDLTNKEDAPEWVWAFQWRHLFGPKTFMEVKYNGWNGFFDLNPQVVEPGIYDGGSGLYSQSQGWFAYYDRNRNQLNASISHFAEGFGKHDLKFGVEIERSKVRDRYGYVDNIFYYDYAAYYPTKQYYAYDYGYDIGGKNARESFFAQDAWHVNDRLTINAGVRFDWVRGYPAFASVNGPAGDNKVYDTKSWAPRLGFAYDVTSDGKTVLKGTYSQYYEGAFFYQYSNGVPGVQDFVLYAYDPSGAKCGPAGNCFTEVDRSPSPIFHIDPNIKQPRVDEWSLGFERELVKDVRLAVTGIYRKDRNIQAPVLPDARWAPTTVNAADDGPDPALNGKPITVYTWVNRDESDQNYVITNPNGFQYLDAAGNVLGTAEASRKYQALMVVLDKRFSNRWQGRISYVLSKNEGTQDNDSFNTYGFSTQYTSASRALVNQFGPLTFGQTHELKVYLTYQVPKIDVGLNAYWRYLSGWPYTPYQQYGSSDINFPLRSGRQVYLEPRGSFRAQARNTLDLRLEKIFKLGQGTDRLSVYADIQNIFNSGAEFNVNTRYPTVSIAGYDQAVNFGAPTELIPPRKVLLGARWSF